MDSSTGVIALARGNADPDREAPSGRAPAIFPAISRLALRMVHFEPLRAAWRIELGPDVVVQGRVWLPGEGRVRVGRGVRFVGLRAAIELRAHEGGEIVVEDDVVIEDGASVEATSRLVIGARTRVGAFCKIMDNHFHRSQGDRFERPPAVPVVIGADATIGPRAVILPGAELGDGASLGPATVLSFHLPAGTVFPGPRLARDSSP
jgi:acetyltransferase-like isoleucine patch superfamily enzyme